MKALLKKIVALCLVATSLVAVLALTSCNIGDVFKSDMEAIMNDILTGDNYTSVYKSTDDTYTTLKVCSGELYISVKNEESTDEYYLWCDEETGEYYYAREWKRGEDKGIQKEKLDKDKYLTKYISLFASCAPNEQVFTYRNILDMAEPVADNHYKYSKETYNEYYFSKTEYTIETDGDKLILLEEFKERDQQATDNKEEGDVIMSHTKKVTYSDIGNTEISIPAKIINK